MILACALFTVMSVAARFGARKLPWAELALARSAFGLAVAVGVAKLRGASLSVESRGLTLGRSALGTVSLVSTFYVLAQPALPLGDVSALLATSPIIIAILAPLTLGEPTSPRTWLSVALCFVGLVVVVQPKLEVAGHLAAICALAASSTAIAMLFLRRLGKSESPEAVAANFAAIATLVTLALAWPELRVEHLASMPWLAATGVSAGLGQLAMTRAYALDDAARVGAVSYSGTVMTQLAAIALLGEPASASTVLGTALIVAGGLVLSMDALRRLAARAAAAA
jgi:drug/metabolite transporter (DMT)-like permease